MRDPVETALFMARLRVLSKGQLLKVIEAMYETCRYIAVSTSIMGYREHSEASREVAIKTIKGIEALFKKK